LGSLLLRVRRAAEAETVFREDLERNPENPWSLHGLAQSLHAQNGDMEATRVKERFRRAWSHADLDFDP